MTCCVPLCVEQVAMEGVCSAHWLEADEVAHGAERIRQALREARNIEAERETEARRKVEEAARLRSFSRDRNRASGVLNAIVIRFWRDVAAGAGRNESLAAAAWAVGRLVAGGELDHATVIARLEDEGKSAGLPMAEVKSVVRGQVRRAASRPRVLDRESVGKRWARA